MKNASLLLITLVTLLASTLVRAQTKIDVIEQYEIRNYDPQKSGLTDLVFEARIEKLTEILNKSAIFGKLVDVYFKIYWLSPSQYKIEVMGLPKGFQEVRDDLTTLIKGKLEFVIPEKFSEKFKAYNLKLEPIADGKLIKAIDDTYTLAIPELDLIFDNQGRLKTIESKSSASLVKTEFFQSPKSWSNNKLVMDKIVTSTKMGATTTTIINSVEYQSSLGMGFPAKLTVKNTSETLIPAQGKEKEQKIKNETGSIIRFTNYEINTGKAQRFILDGLRR